MTLRQQFALLCSLHRPLAIKVVLGTITPEESVTLAWYRAEFDVIEAIRDSQWWGEP